MVRLFVLAMSFLVVFPVQSIDAQTPDIDRIFDLEKPEVDYEWDIDADPAKPTPYWEPKTNTEENEW
jgi:hypothetical protein